MVRVIVAANIPQSRLFQKTRMFKLGRTQMFYVIKDLLCLTHMYQGADLASAKEEEKRLWKVLQPRSVFICACC